MTTILIDNRDFKDVHIDTYQMLDGSSADEMMRDYERENAGADERVYDDDRDITYDMKAITAGLAEASISIVEQAIKFTPAEKMITGIKLLKTGSPKFYNYTTDHYVAEYTIDTEEMDKYIELHKNAVQAILETYTNAYDENLVDNKYHAGVCHMINELIERDDYNMSMWEIESEVYYENMTWTDEK